MISLAKLYFRSWRTTVLLLSLALIAYLLYFHRLDNLLPGYSSSELEAVRHAATVHTIYESPVNAPYNLLVLGVTSVVHHAGLMGRIVAASIGLLWVLAFYMIIRPWYEFRITFLTTILFATSAGFLHAARLGTAEILQMGVLIFIGSVLWYRRRRNHRVLIGYGVAALFALLWYVPGMVWFELFGLVLLGSGLRKQLLGMPSAHVAGWAVVFLGLIAPLVVASVPDPSILLAAAGLPTSLSSLADFPSNVLNAVMSIAVRSNGNPLFWVGHVPLLNVIELILVVIGMYHHLYLKRSLRSAFLFGSSIICLLLIGLNGGVSFACLVPLLYLFIASGLNFLLSQWLAVFPRNPIARTTGIALICIMLGFSILYQVRTYFVAWPHVTATRQAFSHRLPND